MIDKRLLDILVCPETRKPVHLANQSLVNELNFRIKEGKINSRGGHKVETKIDGGLINEDRTYLYPIVDGIPIMLIEDSIHWDNTQILNEVRRQT